MGLSIGQIPSTLAGSNRVDLFSRNTDGPSIAGTRGNDGDTGALFFARPERPRPQVGFGRGTVSGPAAALEALNRGVQAARQSIPSFRELRADQRVRLEARRADTAERVSRAAARADLLDRDREAVGRQMDFRVPDVAGRTDLPERGRADTGRRIDFRVPDVAGRTRDFINQVNEAASFAQARVEGTEIPAGPGRASFVVNGETFTFSSPAGSGGRPLFFGDTNTPTQFDARA